jgi:hypothetical protein
MESVQATIFYAITSVLKQNYCTQYVQFGTSNSSFCAHHEINLQAFIKGPKMTRERLNYGIYGIKLLTAAKTVKEQRVRKFRKLKADGCSAGARSGILYLQNSDLN